MTSRSTEISRHGGQQAHAQFVCLELAGRRIFRRSATDWRFRWKFRRRLRLLLERGGRSPCPGNPSLDGDGTATERATVCLLQSLKQCRAQFVYLVAAATRRVPGIQGVAVPELVVV